MKIIKKFLYIIAFLLIAACCGILVCALNPKLTASLAEKVQQFQLSSDGTDKGAAAIKPAELGNGSFRPAEKPGIRPDPSLDKTAGNYVVPEKNPVKLPQEVSGLTGYRPVEEEAEKIPQEEADNLSSILSNGSLGLELSFSEEYYPYYAMLEEDMKLLYKQIYANASELTTSFTPTVPVDVNRLKNVFEAVCNDHPELFWLETGYSCKYLKNGSCVEITLQYNDTADRLEASKEEFAGCAEAILEKARMLGSNDEKVKYVHDALRILTEYDASADKNQSAYSALVKGKSVCAGYARAFQYLLQQLGIPCYYCTGYSGEDHAWNIVKLDGTYRNVDVTWDDTDPYTYDYFNKTDEEFSATHVRTSLSVYLPACTGDSSQTADSKDEMTVSTPQPTPMSWVSRGKIPGEDGSSTDKTDKTEAGVSEDEIAPTLEKYYEDCENKLKAAGTGYVEFNNVIPESLWNSIERAYSDGSYVKGYVEDALKEMKAENFAIQLQVQRLGGGYYRIYHNIYTDAAE